MRRWGLVYLGVVLWGKVLSFRGAGVIVSLSSVFFFGRKWECYFSFVGCCFSIRLFFVCGFDVVLK